MTTNSKHDHDFDDDMDSMDEDFSIDPFLDAMEMQDGKRRKNHSPRRAIETLLEKRRLKKLLEDYPDFD